MSYDIHRLSFIICLPTKVDSSLLKRGPLSIFPKKRAYLQKRRQALKVNAKRTKNYAKSLDSAFAMP
jgi:hypothetical protein